MSQQQEVIERRLFAARRGFQTPELFLYDVSSSYPEGEDNAFGAYGYDRDGKKGKKQIESGTGICGSILGPRCPRPRRRCGPRSCN